MFILTLRLDTCLSWPGVPITNSTANQFRSFKTVISVGITMPTLLNFMRERGEGAFLGMG